MRTFLGSRKVWLVAIAVAVVLGIGFATYFLGGRPSSKPVAKAATFHFEGVPAEAPVKKISQFTLPFGDDGVAVSVAGLSALEAVFTQSDGSVYVADHLPSRPGARIRWYRGSQKLGQMFAPPGSSLFTTYRNGFAYTIAKGESDSEQLVLVAAPGSVPATFTVPLRINSGWIVEHGNNVYIVAWSGEVDPNTKVVTGREVLVPAVIDGRQATDEEARAGIIEGWRFSGDRRWLYNLHMTPTAKGDETSSTVTLGRSTLEIPYETVRLGVDTKNRMWMFLPPHDLTKRAVAGWPALTDEFGLLVAVEPTGKIAGAMPVRASQGTFWPDISTAREFGCSNDRLTFAEKTASGVLITTYEVR